MPHFPEKIYYGDKYTDDSYEYRNVIITEEIYKKIPRGKLLKEADWRNLGILVIY